jgi:hypothetical protein
MPTDWTARINHPITAAPHVDTGELVILDGLPFSTIVTRVLRTYDDGA